MVMLKPNISEAQRKQDAVLAHNFVPDLTLNSLLDFVDIRDPSVVNVLYQSISKLYETMSKTEYGVNYQIEDI